MKRAAVKYAKGFNVLVGDEHSQAASMVIDSGGHEGGNNNRHRGADQWLYIESGSGEAIINGHAYQIAAGDIVLIQRMDTHENRNTGKSPLKTLSIYLLPIRKMAKRSLGARSRRGAGAFQMHAEGDHDFHKAPITNPIIPASASVVYGCFRRDLSTAFDKLPLTAPT
jgi:mannose-6-phosphate isomerase-like protein (cupin superfamily)